MKIFVGLDDTDTLDSPAGTGHLARLVMAELVSSHILGYGVTRHQLLFDRRIPYTAKNSANVIHLEGEPADIPAIAQCAQAIMLAHFQQGSDPGLCVAAEIPEEIVAFGRRAQSEIVDQQDAERLAAEYGIALSGLGGTNGGHHRCSGRSGACLVRRRRAIHPDRARASVDGSRPCHRCPRRRYLIGSDAGW